MNAAARTKWVYIKPVTVTISVELKSMLHLHSASPHHDSGCVAIDAEMVMKVMAAMENNPFTATLTTLVNISIGQHAEPEVQEHLNSVQVLGLYALLDVIAARDQKNTVVKLKT